VHVAHGLQNAFAAVNGFVIVAQFDVCIRRSKRNGTRRDNSPLFPTNHPFFFPRYSIKILI
jgi:hypothetical protein